MVSVDNSLDVLVVFHRLDQFPDDIFPLLFPLSSIFARIVEKFITGNTKDTAVTELLCQRYNIKIEEANFTLVPGTTNSSGSVTLLNVLAN